jgi:hypothetical protein
VVRKLLGLGQHSRMELGVGLGLGHNRGQELEHEEGEEDYCIVEEDYCIVEVVETGWMVPVSFAGSMDLVRKLGVEP